MRVDRQRPPPLQLKESNFDPPRRVKITFVYSVPDEPHCPEATYKTTMLALMFFPIWVLQSIHIYQFQPPHPQLTISSHHLINRLFSGDCFDRLLTIRTLLDDPVHRNATRRHLTLRETFLLPFHGAPPLPLEDSRDRAYLQSNLMEAFLSISDLITSLPGTSKTDIKIRIDKALARSFRYVHLTLISNQESKCTECFVTKVLPASACYPELDGPDWSKFRIKEELKCLWGTFSEQKKSAIHAHIRALPYEQFKTIPKGALRMIGYSQLTISSSPETEKDPI